MTVRGIGDVVVAAVVVVVAAPAYRGFGLNVPTRILVTIGCDARVSASVGTAGAADAAGAADVDAGVIGGE